MAAMLVSAYRSGRSIATVMMVFIMSAMYIKKYTRSDGIVIDEKIDQIHSRCLLPQNLYQYHILAVIRAVLINLV